MARKILLTKEQLIATLGHLIAEEHYEANQCCFKEDAEAYASEGITEAKYMAGSAEHIRVMINEDTAVAIGDAACKQYERLVRATYPRVKKDDFVW